MLPHLQIVKIIHIIGCCRIAVLETPVTQMPRNPHERSERTALAQWLVAARKARGFNQSELAVAAGVDQSTVSKIEAGSPKVSTGMIDRLAEALVPSGLDPDEAAATARRIATAGKRAAFLPDDAGDDGVGSVRETIYDPIIDELDIAAAGHAINADVVEDIRRYVRFRVNEERQGNVRRQPASGPPPEPGQL